MNKALFLFFLFILIVSILASETIRLNDGNNSIQVLSSTETETILQYNITTFDKARVEINGREYFHISLPEEGITQDKGYPELPVFNRSIIISNTARMSFEVYDVRYVDMELPVSPSRGVIMRDKNPADIPFEFGRIYESREFYPANLAGLSEPYILRDFRGMTVKTMPFAYNPYTRTLRMYTQYKIRVYADGQDLVNTLPESERVLSRDFTPIYENHFINWENYRYTPVNDSFGKLIVICHTNYLTQIAPYVNWKKQKGINTELVQWSTIGTTAAQLQTYIQNRYNADNTIAYIQIVGDAPQIPTLSSGGGGSDPTFSLVAGTDNYPDVFIGRFSAESAADVTAQVNKVITYERDLTTSATWLTRAMGLASAEGGGGAGDNGESDIAHMNLIRTDLLADGYTSVDQIYDPGAAAATVTTNVNAGRGFINYVGHGSDTTWGTTGFSNANASALTNGTMTPFIMDVACVNGNFVSITCFAEAWLRNANGGAIAMYASSINQSWNSPMRAEDECTDLLAAESKTTAGGLYYNSSCLMMDVYGNTASSDGVNMFKTWHIFGDASLLVRSKTPIAMSVTHPAQITIGTATVSVSTGVTNTLIAMTYNNTIYARGYTNSSGNATLTLVGAPSTAITYTITATAFNRVTYISSIQQIAGTGPYVNVTAATYVDSNNNVAEYNETGRFNITYQNVGSVVATSIVTTLTCTTPGITITDNTETIATLAAGASTTVNNAYTFNIANSIANGTSAAFTITMVSGVDTWTHNFTLTINAPALGFGSVTIQDTGGNNNGRLDPGETVTVLMPLNNTGAAASPSGSGTLSCATPGITVNTGTANFTAISAAGNASLSFSVSASPSVSVGTVASLVFNATAGAYTANKTESVTVGLIMENFETGNFSTYPWTLGGNLAWTVINTGAYAGTYCAKSGAITHNQTSTMQTTRVLTSGGNITFWYKVSSEGTYDFLKFYVDGVVQGSWSGEVAWTQATYPLTAGTRILKWEYSKDGSVSTGSDCAWVDNIVFPASTAYIPATIIWTPASFSQTLATNLTASQTLTIGNTGSDALSYTISKSVSVTWLSINGGNTYSSSISGGGANQNITIGFNSTGLSAGTYTANMTLTSNSTTNSTVTIPVQLVVSISGSIIAVNPASLSFGNVVVNTSSVQQFTIQNTGVQTLNGTISTPAGYTVALATRNAGAKSVVTVANTAERNILPFSIGVGLTFTYNLTFTPVASTLYNGNVTINSNAINTTTVNLAVTGAGHLLPVLNLPVNFTMDKNTSLTADFTPYISNPGGYPLTLSVCSCTSMSIQINGMQVTFTPVQNFVGTEVATFNVFDGTNNVTDDVSIIVNQIYLPPWTPVSYPIFATLHGVVTIELLPAALNDVVGAFVGEECRGMGEVRTQNGLAYVDMAINLSGARESVSFRIYDYNTGTHYPVLEDIALSPGVEYGLDTPLPINGTLQIVLAEPVVSCSASDGNIILQWSAVTYAEEYEIYRSESYGGPFSYIGTTTSLQFTDSTVGNWAFYYVKAVRNLPARPASRE
jgi:hypothetical protein